MREEMEARLAALKSEYDKGQTQLRQLESQASSVRETMLRISGAIMVLQELLSASAPPVAIDQPVLSGGNGNTKSPASTADLPHVR
jgi:predicted nuclease with TOPRIM domain